MMHHMTAQTRSQLPRCIHQALLCVAALLSICTGAAGQKSVPNADFVAARPVINMFARASSDSKVTSQVLYGTGVLSLEKQGGWIRIRTADDYTGWVSAAALQAEPNRKYVPTAERLRIVAISANVYREPDITQHAPLLLLPWEATLQIAPDVNNKIERWLKVRLVDGQSAWIQRGDTASAAAPLTIEETLRLARRFMGITYTWGGVSTFGFDCSGFTQMLVRQRGIEMPRDASAQAAWTGADPVERKDLKPGDLLFFGSSTSHITHTGMYLGNDEFIHDTVHDHPGVQISRLDEMPWTRLLVAARRVRQ